MSMSSEAVKRTARTALKDNYIKSMICCTVFVFAYLLSIYANSLFDFVMGKVAYYIAFTLVGIFVLLPLFLGLLRFFWRSLFGADDKITVMFYCFSSPQLYKKALGFILLFILKFAVWGILLYLPAILIDVIASPEFFNLFKISPPIWISNLWPISSFLKIIAFVAMFSVFLKYYIAPVLFIADDNMDSAEAIHMSTIIAKGSAIDFVYLFFSLIGWIFICLFLIPIIFVMPYLVCSYLVHVRFAVAKYNKHISVDDDNIPTFAV